MTDTSRKWRLSGIRDSRVLAALEQVPRHLFVPASQVERAYEDVALPIDQGQTISQPFIVAFMTENLQPKTTDRILEIGCGSGYQAAVLSGLVEHVFSVEIDPVLAKQATERLKKLGYDNVTVKAGDGFEGWIQEAPFDGIIVTAAATSVPAPLLEQLKEGGKMVIPLGAPADTQELVLIQKEDSAVTSRSLLPVRFVPFRRDPEAGK